MSMTSSHVRARKAETMEKDKASCFAARCFKMKRKQASAGAGRYRPRLVPFRAFYPKMLDFTMIELLIVISMIAILAGLLLPALNRAKDAAQSISCLGNTRQIGIAVQSYFADNRDWYPAVYLNSTGRIGQGYEFHLLQTYFGITDPHSKENAPKDNFGFGTDNPATTSVISTMRTKYKAWICPDNKSRFNLPRQPLHSYAFIVSQNLTPDNMQAATAMAGRKIIGVVRPSDKVACLDGRGTLKNQGMPSSVNNWNLLLPGGGSFPGARPLDIGEDHPARYEYYMGRHGRKLSIVFLEGHAESLTPDRPVKEYYVNFSGGYKMFRPLEQ
ncbi:MAG: hypothetical protein BWY31_01751 [Lentisphaerae bacterium ADurb.Bin242]|nr:MAG: hypothetical protein BWY31_01751 [Lentisphaerae bacterium ADurb.Bin242]